jgi:SagB-type dehydrogenase family enzyme
VYDGGVNASASEEILAYHESTKHSPGSVASRWFMDWSNKPAPFKLYHDARRFDLPTDVRPGDVRALDAIARVSMGDARLTELSALSPLLVFGAGIHHAVRDAGGERWHFRTYASAGALYPNEVYVVSGDLDGLAAGVYHFQPSGPTLARLREGDHRSHLVGASAGEPRVMSADVVLVITGIPWRTAWKYAEHGYRHLFWDAGMILANVLALAAAVGVASRVVLGFVDTDVEALLGLGPRREFPICLVALGAGGSEVPASAALPELTARAMPLSRTEYTFEAITKANEAGRLEAPDAVRRWRERAYAWGQGREGESIGETEVRDAMGEVLARRGSARRFGDAPMTHDVLVDILRRATRGIPTDHTPEGSRLIDPYLIANRVDGLEPGAYAWRRGAAELVRAGDLRREATFLCFEQPLAGTSAATLFLLSDLAQALDRFGPRGYRATQLEAGIVGGKIYLGAYAHRFGATGLTFFDDEVEQAFAPDAAGKSCMLVVAVGDSPRLHRRLPR